MATREIRVDYLARVEGEGALTIRYDGEEVETVELKIFEPPRFFEALLRGRAAVEAPDITARICGICPVAYQMSACRAVEAALGMEVPKEIVALRRLLYYGEWIESHALHAFMLHAPDFLGFDDAIGMAEDHKEQVVAGLKIKKAGNALVAALGGREIHPINVRVGGWYRAPAKRELSALLPDLVEALGLAEQSLAWFAGFEFADIEHDYDFVALRHPTDYAIYDGRITSSSGLDLAPDEIGDAFEEHQVPHSTALHSRIRGRGAYHCGPLARINLGFDTLRDRAREAAQRCGFSVPCKNPQRSILARMIEVVHALDGAIAEIGSYREPEEPFVEAPVRAGVGWGATEAPRGLLYHRYEIADDGTIESATIVPPTAQNQATIEADLRQLAPSLRTLPLEQATWQAEQAIRNYDPCISCSTHFLTLKREGIDP